MVDGKVRAQIRTQIQNHATAAIGEIIGTAMFLFIVSK